MKQPNIDLSHLRAETRNWVELVYEQYVLEAHHERLLMLAAETLDEVEAAREIVAREGLTVITDRGGRKAHPCMAVMRDGRIAFARLLKALDLDHETALPVPGQRSHHKGVSYAA